MTDFEQVLFEAIRAGDSEVFASWLAGAEPVLRRALKPWAALVDVEAVLQEGLLRVWQVAPRLEPDGKPEVLLRFAHVVVRNLATSEARKWKATPADLAALPPDDAPPLQPLAPDPHLRAKIADCRGKLPGKPKLALDARLGSDGNTHDATLAESLGMSLNTFLQNFTRARKLLQECLQKAGVDLALELGR